MLRAAAAMTGVDLSSSYLVGDTLSDLRAAQQASLRGAALVLTGHGQTQFDEHRTAIEALSLRVSVVPDAASAIAGWLRASI
jgi:histidinol phosphatase-like enzyme